jgi:hypothetical protein
MNSSRRVGGAPTHDAQLGHAHISRPRPSPRRERVVATLLLHDEVATPPLPPLPAPGEPLSRMDEDVLAAAQADPASCLALLMSRPDLARLGPGFGARLAVPSYAPARSPEDPTTRTTRRGSAGAGVPKQGLPALHHGGSTAMPQLS